MNNSFSFLLLFLLVQIPATAQSKQFTPLYALAGTWKMETSDGTLYESWEKVNDSTLRGKSYKLTRLDSMALESAELVLRRKKILYIPTVLVFDDPVITNDTGEKIWR